MIVVPHKEHSLNEPLQIYIQVECFFKCCIHNLQMNVPFINLICHKFLFPLLVCGKDVKHFVAFSKPIWKCMFHLEHIDFKDCVHNCHGYYATKWYIHLNLGFGMNLMPFHHLNYLELVLHLDLEDTLVSNCID